MDGQFQINIENWVINNIDMVSRRQSQSIHIPDLFLGNSFEVDIIEISLWAFDKTIELVERMGNSVQPILYFPLTSNRKKISFKSPKNITDLRLQLDKLEPPSIFLKTWMTSLDREDFEEYKIPLPLLFSPMRDNLLIYYSESRNRLAINYDFEYSRGLVIKYFPRN